MPTTSESLTLISKLALLKAILTRAWRSTYVETDQRSAVPGTVRTTVVTNGWRRCPSQSVEDLCEPNRFSDNLISPLLDTILVGAHHEWLELHKRACWLILSLFSCDMMGWGGASSNSGPVIVGAICRY